MREKLLKPLMLICWSQRKLSHKHLTNKIFLCGLSKCGRYVLAFLDFRSKWVALSSSWDWMTLKIVQNNYSHFRINTFHATGLFWFPLKTSENQSFSDVFRGYRKKPVARNGLKSPITMFGWNVFMSGWIKIKIFT